MSQSQPADVQLRDEMGAPTLSLGDASEKLRRYSVAGSELDRDRITDYVERPGRGQTSRASLTHGRWSGSPGATAASKTVLSRGF